MIQSWFNSGLTIIIDPWVLQIVSEKVFGPYQAQIKQSQKVFGGVGCSNCIIYRYVYV